MAITLPERALVLLIGASGSGKSTFARRHFLPTEIVSSDHCRALISDDEADQSVSKDAFEILYLIANKRLARGRLAVIDATNVQPEARTPLIEMAKTHGAPAVAIVFDIPLATLLEHNRARPGRVVEERVIETQAAALAASLPLLAEEGYAAIYRAEALEH